MIYLARSWNIFHLCKRINKRACTVKGSRSTCGRSGVQRRREPSGEDFVAGGEGSSSINRKRRHSCRFVGNKSIYVPGAPGLSVFAFDSPETKINAFRPFSRMKGATRLSSPRSFPFFAFASTVSYGFQYPPLISTIVTLVYR